MKGTCLRCGEGGCAWIDDREDLCTRCARGILLADDLPGDLAYAWLVIRALKASLFETARHVGHLSDFLSQVQLEVGPETTEELAARRIWTPGDDL